jgi:ribosomal protein L15
MASRYDGKDLNSAIEEAVREGSKDSGVGYVARDTVSPTPYKMDLPSKAEKYKQIYHQLDLLKSGLKEHLQQNYTIVTVEDKTRTETAMVVKKDIANMIRRVFGMTLKETPVERVVVDKIEKVVPLNKGSVKDLQNMITHSVETLDSYNRHMEPTIHEIESVTSGMREMQKMHLQRFVDEKKAFDRLEESVTQYEGLLVKVTQELQSIKITDDGFVRTHNNKDELENIIIKSKYDLQEHHNNTLLSWNQKGALRVYEKCLGISKFAAEQYMNYVDNFTKNARELNVSLENADIVVNYLAKTFELGQNTVALVQTSMKYLSQVMHITGQAIEQPTVKVVDAEVLEKNANTIIGEVERRLEQYSQEQKHLNEMVRPHLRTTNLYDQPNYELLQKNQTRPGPQAEVPGMP